MKKPPYRSSVAPAPARLGKEEQRISLDTKEDGEKKNDLL
jgi:hypothetical protein